MDCINVAIVTVSDRCYFGTQADVSGSTLSKLACSEKQVLCNVKKRTVIPDDVEVIKLTLLTLSQPDAKIDLILTCGGTGFAPRDVTPEATKAIITKEASGLIAALINATQPFSALSCMTAGIRNKCLIVNLPGSEKAVKEYWPLLPPILKHAVDLLRDNQHSVARYHKQLQSKIKSNVIIDIPCRARQSSFPLLHVHDAYAIMLESLHLEENILELSIENASGYVLAQSVYADEPFPSFETSRKDGYAVIANDTSLIREVLATSTAGNATTTAINLKPGYCVRINTGAPLPLLADAVIQVEDTTLVESKGGEEYKIAINKLPVHGNDIRHIGSDIQKDECVLEKDTLLTSSDLAILATIGKSTLTLYEKPSVAVMSSGNELADPRQMHLQLGQVRDSNRLMLISLLENNGFKAINLGIVPDDPDSIVNVLYKGFEQAQVVICTGGVSMGEHDFLKQVLEVDLHFTIHFGRVFMKPGKPTTFASGQIEGQRKYFFGLPGNPMSAWVTAHLFPIPALRKLSHWKEIKFPEFCVKLKTNHILDERPEYCCAKLEASDVEFGVPLARMLEFNQISSRPTCARNANLLLKFPPSTEEKPEMLAGDYVTALLIHFSSLFWGTDLPECIFHCHFERILLYKSIHEHISAGTA
ncbi:Molybdenum cofactor synthesis protein cinnamon [Trichinella murrelli]|uniref:Molybdenum cofactor synthesis protein cinnamon n=1 Tax=Trichinella murrelli TaxID=144512 RepID=A0A0V0U5R5_9BILA|nr:Molybdenum cofactor synthesis protein cinnamon [Trichinella murrelli]